MLSESCIYLNIIFQCDTQLKWYLSNCYSAKINEGGGIKTYKVDYKTELSSC